MCLFLVGFLFVFLSSTCLGNGSCGCSAGVGVWCFWYSGGGDDTAYYYGGQKFFI